MALDQKKLQKKKARKAKKAKARKQKSGGGGLFAGVAEQSALLKTLNAPIYECWEPGSLEESGIGSVVVSRKSPSGDIAMAVFLVDAYCLGVKDAFVKLVNETEYQEMIEGMRLRGGLNSIHPTCARKLVESAIEWAGDLGFKPHKDYRAARRIFGDIDPAACPRSFEFGKEGNPLFVPGPHDSPTFVRKVHKTLEKRVGQDQYHFIQPIDPSVLSGGVDSDDEA